MWIADPDESLYADAPWVWLGSFLYLTEMHWDAVGFQTVFSGCSALQMVVNVVSGRELLAANEGDEFEPFGRGSRDHPVEKLRRIGANVSDRGRITTLYRTRYMSNEQCYTINCQERRVNDLFAYPIYIAAAP